MLALMPGKEVMLPVGMEAASIGWWSEVAKVARVPAIVGPPEMFQKLHRT